MRGRWNSQVRQVIYLLLCYMVLLLECSRRFWIILWILSKSNNGLVCYIITLCTWHEMPWKLVNLQNEDGSKYEIYIESDQPYILIIYFLLRVKTASSTILIPPYSSDSHHMITWLSFTLRIIYSAKKSGVLLPKIFTI